MNLDTPYTVTEWEWFKLQLKIYSIENHARYWFVSFQFPAPGKITCAIWCIDTQEFVDTYISQAEQLRAYTNWVQREKRSIGKLIETLPVLKTEFSLERDVKFEIIYDYGMGNYAVCTFDEAGVHGGPTADRPPSRWRRILYFLRRRISNLARGASDR